MHVGLEIKVCLLLLLQINQGCFTLGQTECPRDLSLVEEGRTCRKSCETDANCRGALKRCRCDDVCGMSCYNPDATCNDPGILVNGRISGAMTYGEQITYTCDEAYRLDGSATRTCRSDKKWSGSAPTCYEVCFPPRPSSTFFPNNGKQFYRIGDVLSYACRLGYNQYGNPNVTCQTGGSWSRIQINCLKKDCGNPGELRYGYKVGDDFLFGSRVRFYCNKGYELRGDQFVSCNTRGRWLGDVPTCEIVECPAPIQPEHGSVGDRGSDYEYENIVTYSCNTGYRLEGNERGTCNENATWGDVPTCVVERGCNFEVSTRPTCGYQSEGVGWDRVFLRNVHNGLIGYVVRADLPSSGVNAQTKLLSPVMSRQTNLCLSFYYFIRNSNGPRDFILSTVDSRGTRIQVWSIDEQDPSNTWLSSELSFDADRENIQFEFLVQRTSSAPTSIDLDDISVLEDARCVDECSSSPCTNGGRCIDRINNFQCFCASGFEGSDCSTIVKCDVPNPPQFGWISTTQNKIPVDGSITYGCIDGYRLVGSAISMCLPDRSFSTHVPRCVRNNCPDPSAQFATTRPNKSSWVFEDVVTYTCTGGYDLIGSSTATCLSNGQWSHSSPTCDQQPEAESCPPGYILSFPFCFKLVLTQRLTYNGAAADCNRDGATLPIIRHRQVGDKLRSVLGQRQGWYWIGLTDKTNERTLAWHTGEGYDTYSVLNRYYNPPYNSKAKDCVAYGRHVWIGTIYADHLYFRDCSETHNYVCMKWSSQVRALRLSSQDPLANLYNGVYFPDNGNLRFDRPYYFRRFASGGVIMFSFVLSGLRYWKISSTSNRFYLEVQSDAEVPNRITERWYRRITYSVTINEEDEWDNWNTWSECSAMCGHGIRTRTRRCVGQPAGSIYCQGPNSQRQSCNIRSCSSAGSTKVNCIVPNPPQHGWISTTLSAVLQGRSITYNCDDDYRMLGHSSHQLTVTCRSDRRWTDQAPRCVVRSCIRPQTSSSIEILPPVLESYGRGSTLTFSCINREENVVGNTEAVCQNDGTWDAPPPSSCRRTSCSNIEEPSNGNLRRLGSVDFYQPNSYARITCDNHYRLVGPNTVICQSNYRWSDDVPTCEAIGCRIFVPSVPAGITITDVNSFEYQPGETLQVSCTQRSQNLNLNPTLTCRIGNRWEPNYIDYRCA